MKDGIRSKTMLGIEGVRRHALSGGWVGAGQPILRGDPDFCVYSLMVANTTCEKNRQAKDAPGGECLSSMVAPLVIVA